MPIYLQIILVTTHFFILFLIIYAFKLFLKIPEAQEVPNKRKSMRMRVLIFSGYFLIGVLSLFFLTVLGKALWQYVIH